MLYLHLPFTYSGKRYFSGTKINPLTHTLCINRLVGTNLYIFLFGASEWIYPVILSVIRDFGYYSSYYKLAVTIINSTCDFCYLLLHWTLAKCYYKMNYLMTELLFWSNHNLILLSLIVNVTDLPMQHKAALVTLFNYRLHWFL